MFRLELKLAEPQSAVLPLHYIHHIGVKNRLRTYDTQGFNLMLYQLSYISIMVSVSWLEQELFRVKA